MKDDSEKNPLDLQISTIAHWSRGGQKVVPQKLQAKSTTKRFGQIYLRKYNKNQIGVFVVLGYMSLKIKNTFSPLHIPVLVKSKKYFAILFRFIWAFWRYANQLFMFKLNMIIKIFKKKSWLLNFQNFLLFVHLYKIIIRILLQSLKQCKRLISYSTNIRSHFFLNFLSMPIY